MKSIPPQKQIYVNNYHKRNEFQIIPQELLNCFILAGLIFEIVSFLHFPAGLGRRSFNLLLQKLKQHNPSTCPKQLTAL